MKDSHSYINPYNQSEHAWTDAQHNQSNEVAWSKETNITAAGYTDHVNNTGPSRLVPNASNTTTLTQQGSNNKYRIETHSIIIPYVVRDNAWNFDHHDNSNFTAYKDDAPAGYNDQDYTDPVTIPDGTTNTTLPNCTTAEEADYAAEVIANAHAGLPPPAATCMTAAARAAAAANRCNATNATNGTNATNATNGTNATNACNATNATNASNGTATPSNSNALKIKATPANASKIGAKKVDVPKVTAPAANKPVETKKPSASNQTQAKPVITKKPAAVNKTNSALKEAAKPIVVAKPSKVSVNHTAATPVKEQNAKASNKPEFAPKTSLLLDTPTT